MQGPFLTIINSAQTKVQFVVEKNNDGFDVLAKFVDGAANDIHFDPLFVHMSQRNGWVKLLTKDKNMDGC